MCFEQASWSIRIILTKECPHCQKLTQHQREIILPLRFNPAYKIICSHCQGLILVSWAPHHYDGEITANFSKLPLAEQ